MAELARLVDDGKLRAAVSTTFGLGDLREAFAAQQARSHPGKVVITVA
jgi:NADPH:quinone reductase-like Zn-dependent oxidoreductase